MSRPIRPTIQSRGGAAGEPGKDALREALSYWASGVAVLAVSDGEEVDAITVTAFSAVSLVPPRVLVCVNENSSTLPTLLEERRFTVSLLPEEQARSAAAIAQRLPGSLSAFRPGADPVVEGALASFVCRLWEAYPGGDHRILVGEVERVEVGGGSGALLYYRRRYRRLPEAAGP